MPHPLAFAVVLWCCGACGAEGTPADLILNMMGELLSGSTPLPEDVILVRTAILQARDIYTPLDLQQQMANCMLDVGPGAHAGACGWCSMLARSQG